MREDLDHNGQSVLPIREGKSPETCSESSVSQNVHIDSEETYDFSEQKEAVAIREMPRTLPVRDNI